VVRHGSTAQHGSLRPGRHRSRHGLVHHCRCCGVGGAMRQNRCFSGMVTTTQRQPRVLWFKFFLKGVSSTFRMRRYIIDGSPHVPAARLLFVNGDHRQMHKMGFGAEFHEAHRAGGPERDASWVLALYREQRMGIESPGEAIIWFALPGNQKNTGSTLLQHLCGGGESRYGMVRIPTTELGMQEVRGLWCVVHLS
jgi:hypothetical protein